jgi:hypothetical protein
MARIWATERRESPASGAASRMRWTSTGRTSLIGLRPMTGAIRVRT